MPNPADQPLDPDRLLPLALTSYGHFTTMLVGADGRVRGLGLHLERLARDSEAVFGAGVDTGLVREAVRRALDGRELPAVVRVTHHDPGFDLARPVAARRPEPLVTVRPAGSGTPPPVRLRSVAYGRELPYVKHCGLFGALHARRAAQLAGYDDALFTGGGGDAGPVSEGPTWNIGFVTGDGEVVWPEAPDAPALAGVTMALLRRGFEHRTAPVTAAEARDMRAAFLTNAAVGVRAVAAIDGTDLDPGDPVLDALREAYRAVPGEEI
ncbi:aminotransferase class IV [Streptomyces sp. NPDC006798]|uniref:aminotransferase class IV n=1 Tax=Streptomyces sp. NPDC006798 TaxID=3155462 RepID=UPI0033DD6D51